MTDTRVAVLAADRRYRAAVAELPARTRLASSPADARLVVLGPGATRGALDAASRADALVLADGAPPSSVPPSPRPGVVIVAQRRWLRADVVEEAVAARDGAPHTVLVIECVAAASELPAILADALGWARAFLPEGVRLDDAQDVGGAGAASLRSVADGSPVSIGYVVQRGAANGGMLRINALGVVRTEVVVDLAARRTTVDTLRRDGRLRAPERFERAERVALRRAVDALENGTIPADAEQLLQDLAIAEAILAGRAAVLSGA